MSEPLRLAVLGLGRWGVHLLRNFLALPGAEVVAVADFHPETLARVQAQFSLNQVQCFVEAEETLTLPGLQAVAIATPAATHYPLIKSALQRGLHVLTEKPMTLNVHEGQELCELAAQNGCQLMVDHTYLFHPAVKAGKHVFQEQQLGTLRYGYAARTNLGPVRYDVDALWDLAIHDIAIFNFWLAESPVQVSAWGLPWLQPQPRHHFPQGLADMGWVRLVYPGGFETTIHVSWLNPDKQRRLGVVGEQGTLVFDELAKDVLTLHRGLVRGDEPHFQPASIEAIALPVENVEPLAQVCRHFLDCVREGTPSPVSSGAIANTLVKILAALSQSLQNDGSRVPL
ncbi:MAG TPA: Gfo/Idh/MocA family oxidoreductase [Leptolyngbyaceae cyanobacterium]